MTLTRRRASVRRSGTQDSSIPTAPPLYPPHCVRHFFASGALGHGIPVHEVSRWLGHRSIKTTADIYGTSSPPPGNAAGRSCRQCSGPHPPDGRHQLAAGSNSIVAMAVGSTGNKGAPLPCEAAP
ncbi:MULTISPECIES: hypothetical protein [unclassified Streptomyces]|uniref:hypothetical protein n=1 Tax=unclassified Streptomyces TaxID=2593676 RepID=UPI0033F21080